ncbi:MAG: TIGR03364 family FAD-dependent oxidoreductase [Bacteroidota bacterium]|nr:TIGR03364 family FAD-dependent oxidoreductase [Bacteroidota bacterium]
MKYDVCIVGAGIVGLAHAYWASKKGLKVLVIEKNNTCFGASIRNFGLFWEIGQEEKYKKLVADSKKVWSEFFHDTGIWYKPLGSLGLAYTNDELELINEFVSLYPNANHQILSKKQIEKKYPFINTTDLAGALYSQNEITINSRETIPSISEWLNKKYNVDFVFNTTAVGIDLPKITTNTGSIKANKIIISSGADFELLYPAIFSEEKITKCKLQMIKTETILPIIEPAVYTTTSFIHYESFSKCKTLEVIKNRIKKEQPDYLTHGINLLIAQNNYNELLIGDSHQYDDSVNPFNSERIDDLFLSGIKKIIPTIDFKIKERWHGVYVKSHSKKFLISKPEENVLIVNALAGAGMTLSFGLAKKTIMEFI